ncbi:hypothetical protein [Hyphomicrobium sp.]|uniref:hypothetical protein n=1 Tax=Hyphomicrobium sp. TaxID=82 RepID=UPI002E365E00|nr:hypothetical protein [Hyphomicrobium sp.]HEX2840234.1 hypothetical protein [Hyphomicrobium sp.]
MTTKLKTAFLTAAALMMTAGVSVAAPAKAYTHGYGKPGYTNVAKHRGVNGFERAAIARSAANLAALKRRVWADGKVTFVERMQLRNAERRHAALVARAYRS